MILLSIVFALINGEAQPAANAIFFAAQEAVTITLKMAGIFCLWGGLMRIAVDSGLIKKIEFLLSPLLNRLFPGIRYDDEAKSAIAVNLSANLLGLGNAATPAGIAAMQRLHRLSGKADVASPEMILFVVLNSSCVRLIPTTVAMLRLESGSAAPMEILPATLLVSFSGCFVAVLLTKLLEKMRK